MAAAGFLRSLSDAQAELHVRARTIDAFARRPCRRHGVRARRVARTALIGKIAAMIRVERIAASTSEAPLAFLGTRSRSGLVAAALLTLAMSPHAGAQQTAAGFPPAAAASGLPLPRFVSLKSDRVHARQGPGLDQKVLWIYRRAGLPLEITAEVEGWRRIRDSEGAEGWVAQSLVSGRRTALVMPWEAAKGQSPRIELKSDDSDGAGAVAIIEAGVIADIRSCDSRWCLVAVGSYRGYLKQGQLWGVYPGETIR
jgi:SH3-like domain-containing protein